jgi:S1-C subfamily serine protease
MAGLPRAETRGPCRQRPAVGPYLGETVTEHSPSDGDAPLDSDAVDSEGAGVPSVPPAVPLGPADTHPTEELSPPTPTEPVPVASSSDPSDFLPSTWSESASPTSSAPAIPVGAVPVWGPITPTTATGGEGTAEGPRQRGWLWGVVALVAALVGALIGGGIVAATTHNGSTTVKEISSGPALLNGTTNIEQVIAKVQPAIVSIDAKSGSSSSTQSIFGDTSSGVQEDQGTGMIITSDGEVVTNNHVIAGATTITVTLFGSLKALPAKLIDTDPTNDVALLQITGQSDLPTVSYGDSDNVQVGDAVVAIGNALGLSAGTPTVTQGIISAKGRTVQASDSSGTTSETLTNMFQTDAAINPGNSGGPLVDSSGKVIGMNTAVAASADGTSQAQNIGFAIPANKIEKLLPALRAKSISGTNQAGTAYLGVSLETLTAQLRSQYNFVPTQGAVVLQVESGSPAESAGLQQGDVITSFDGKAVTSADQLATAVQARKPGAKVTVGLYRGQTQMMVSVTLGSSSAQQQTTG